MKKAGMWFEFTIEFETKIKLNFCYGESKEDFGIAVLCWKHHLIILCAFTDLSPKASLTKFFLNFHRYFVNLLRFYSTVRAGDLGHEGDLGQAFLTFLLL
jgi:hypothetical protein